MTATTEYRQEIARAILNQLASSQQRLIAAVGAKDFWILDNGITFRIMQNAGKVRITLSADDTYRMEFGNIRKLEFKVRKSFDGVYGDQMRGSSSRPPSCT